MALSTTMKTDLYRFFAVAFDAAPGATYMTQLADAANSGMTIQQIVEVFTTKPQFTSVYPNFFTNAQFADKLIETVVGASATAEAKTEAKASVEAALALGGEWTRGKVIYQIFNNLANKAADDATWGATSKMMANQVAYAQYYTEVVMGDATDMAPLRAVIANVTATSGTTTADLAAALTPAPVAQTFTLTTGVDTVAGTSGNDTISGILGTTGATLSGLDIVVGGSGNDTLNILDVDGGTSLPGTFKLSSVETVNVRSAGAATINLTGTGISDVTALNSTQSAAATLTAAATTNVSVSGAIGSIAVAGGKNITVADSTADNAITVGGSTTTNPAGTVSVTDTKVGTALITVDGGTDVTVTASGVTIAAANNFDSDNNSVLDTKAAVVVGHTTAATGTATVSSSGAVITTSSTNATLGAIEVNAKGNISVTQAATSDASAAAADTSGVATITQGAVKVVTGADATSVSVVQSAAATAIDAVKAVAGVKETQVLTFAALTATGTTTIDGLTFTAAKALTAAEVAAAFANLTKGATGGSAPASNGTYSGTLSSNWTSGDVSTASVTFTAAAASGTNATLVTTAGTVDPTVGTHTDGVTEVLAKTGRLGAVAGAVTVNGAITGTDVLSTVTLNSYGTSTVASDALTTLNLSNSAGGLTVTSASTGSVTLNLDKLTGAVALGATATGVVINATGTKSASAVTAAGATTVTVNAAADMDLTGSSLGVATKMVVTGAGKVTLDGEAGTSVLATIDASAATGTVDASAATLKATTGKYIGGSGADTFTVVAGATSANTGGAGNDVITVSTLGSGGSVDAGDGVDTLKMAAADAATASASAAAALLFNSQVTNFEKLSLGSASSDSVDLSKLVFTDVTTGGGTLTLANAASGVTVNIGANSTITVGVKDAATGTADVVNIASNSDGNLTMGTVTAANVETVNINAVDKVVDVSGAFDAYGAAAADGKDDTNSVQILTLAADTATTVNVSGSADLQLMLSSSTAVTTVNASAMTGIFTMTANGKSTGTTVTGGSAADVLTASGSGDILIGGAGNDKLTADLLTTLTGGDGKDTFVMPTVVDATKYSTITDLSAGDVIDTTAGTFATTKITLASNSTFAQYLDAAVAAASTVSGTAAAQWFQFNGDTFLVVDGYTSGTPNTDAAAYSATEDTLIAITGLVDLSKAMFNATTGDLTIV